HPIARSLVHESGVPVAAPSANLFTRPSPTCARHVIHELGDAVDMIVDGGDADIGVESTVLDLTAPNPKVLRPGGVTIEDLRAVLPKVAFEARYITDGETEPAASPGLLSRHYSPQASLQLFRGEEDTTLQRMIGHAEKMLQASKRVGILCATEDLEAFHPLSVATYDLGPKADRPTMANRLFDGIRTLDAHDLDLILARSYSEEGIGLAIWDRLFRAAEGHVMEP
ncbi:MAG: Sua5 family C-terminal domain-containing protein, partial [Verrucomicrobiota bacterium]